MLLIATICLEVLVYGFSSEFDDCLWALRFPMSDQISENDNKHRFYYAELLTGLRRDVQRSRKLENEELVTNSILLVECYHLIFLWSPLKLMPPLLESSSSWIST